MKPPEATAELPVWAQLTPGTQVCWSCSLACRVTGAARQLDLWEANGNFSISWCCRKQDRLASGTVLASK